MKYLLNIIQAEHVDWPEAGSGGNALKERTSIHVALTALLLT